MLPGGVIRHRNKSLDLVKSMHNLSSIMNDSTRRYKKLPSWAKGIFLFSIVFSFVFYGIIFHQVLSYDVTDDKFLEVDMCPACFGSSACRLIYDNQVKIDTLSNNRFSDYFSHRNNRYATLFGNKYVVMKHLGTEEEFSALDSRVCQDAQRAAGCDVSRVFYRTDLSVSFRKENLLPKHMTHSANMFTCASYRLLDRMWGKYKELRKSSSDVLLGDQLQVWYTASLNAEPLILQTFPAHDGWPFPAYIGACGRHVIVENVGQTLDTLYHEPFHTRAGLAYELLKIANHLTYDSDDFALYIADPSWRNFGVDASGKVRILDAENIIVVDKLAITARQPKDYDRFLQSERRHCDDIDGGGEVCLTMVPDSLCSRLHSDHNFYAICTEFLDPWNEGPWPGGLLHDMPEEAKDFWDVENLLRECSRPTKYKGRIIVKDNLMTALHNLRDQSVAHLALPIVVKDGAHVPQSKPRDRGDGEV